MLLFTSSYCISTTLQTNTLPWIHSRPRPMPCALCRRPTTEGYPSTHSQTLTMWSPSTAFETCLPRIFMSWQVHPKPCKCHHELLAREAFAWSRPPRTGSNSMSNLSFIYPHPYLFHRLPVSLVRAPRMALFCSHHERDLVMFQPISPI
jgi:hypothetical protein